MGNRGPARSMTRSVGHRRAIQELKTSASRVLALEEQVPARSGKRISARGGARQFERCDGPLREGAAMRLGVIVPRRGDAESRAVRVRGGPLPIGQI